MSKNNVSNSIVRSHRPALPQRAYAKSERSLFSRVLIGSVWGLCGTMVLGILLISIFAAIACSKPDPMAIVPYLSLGALMPGMFLGGLICAKAAKGSPILCGLVSGAISTLAFLLLSLIFKSLQSADSSLFGDVIVHASAIFFSVLGSYTGNLKKRNPKRRFG